MREMTFAELDGQLAEQLPARELMGGCCHRSGNYASAGNDNSGSIASGNQVQVNILSSGNDNGNFASAGAST